jgi:hypothetical protein
MQAKLLKIGWVIMLILGIYRIAVASAIAATGARDVFGSIDMATTGAAIIGITLGSYRKAEKWSWWCLLVVGLAGLVGSTMSFGLQPGVLVGWVLFILALAIPAKAILGQKST